MASNYFKAFVDNYILNEPIPMKRSSESEKREQPFT